MAGAIYDEVVRYVQENPGLIAGAIIAVLVIGATHTIVSAALTQRTSGVLTETYQEYPLLSKKVISHNTRLFRFSLPSPTSTLGLPLGRHLSLRATIDGREVRRPYTPVSPIDETGAFELLIKVYPEPHGLMSRYLDALEIGQSVQVRGPLGKFTYARNSYSRLCMVCGGTGITPMYQVLKALLADAADRTRITLVFANVTVDDILLKEELDYLDETNDRFEVFYALNEPPMNWRGYEGFVTKEILADRFGPPEDTTLALMCGPPPMNKAMKTYLAALGYKDSNVFKF